MSGFDSGGMEMIQNVGNILCKLREEMGISQTQLGQGLATPVEMSRLENGVMEMDVFLLEGLFQRLGKSVDKLELTISEGEYKLMILRAMMTEGFSDRDYELVELLLEEYALHPDSSMPLHRQYRMWMEALYCYMAKGDEEACEKGLVGALEITAPLWRDGFSADCRLCTQEVRIFLFLCALQLGMGETGSVRKQLGQLMACLEKWCTDAEEKAKVYPQCAWILGKACYTEEDWDAAYDICSRGVACLAENGVLTVVDKLLEVQEACLDQMGREEEGIRVRKIRYAIAFLYQIADVKAPEGDMLYLLLVREQKELVVDRELLKELRLSKGLSQANLSEGICSWETLSRIEGGKRKPNKKKLHRMFQRMGMDRTRYYGYIQADDFELHEKVREIHVRWEWGDSQGAMMLTEELEEKLDMTVPVNRQFIETHKMIFAVRQGQLAGEEAVREAERILCYTMRDYEGTVYRIPFRQECVILNQIALQLRHSGRIDEAIELWGQILDRFQASEVAERYHVDSLMLIYLNYAGSLEANGCLEKSEEVALRGIRLALKCQRGDSAASILANLACVYEKYSTRKKPLLSRDCLEHSFCLLQFYKNDKSSNVVKKYYEEKYGKDISTGIRKT